MAVKKLENPEKACRLFDGWNETMIWSCLQGVMGAVYAEGGEVDSPAAEFLSAAAVLGDFTFLAGRPKEELAAFRPEESRSGFRILVPQDASWFKIIEQVYGKRAERTVRYAIKKEPDVFDRKKLFQAVESLPDGYELCLMDGTFYRECLAEGWSRDLVSQYPDYERYSRYGLGAVVRKEGRIVSGASSYACYQGGIEIEVDTRPDHRRKGLAFVCAARLILECLDRGLYPSWDAHNRESAALAEKLGYHFDREYPVYFVDY